MTYGVKDICKRFGVGEHTVLAWIKSGELVAINVSRRLGGRPRWRFTVEAIQAFETLRAAMPAQPRSRRRRTKAADVLSFIRSIAEWRHEMAASTGRFEGLVLDRKLMGIECV